jgi:2,3-bisphosphoglycerate-dependent phosphoglycerate mutase
MGTLILVRHGQSQWNLENRFTGWTDIPLTEQGRKDAILCGKSLSNFTFDEAFISRLSRSRQTLEGIMEGSGQKNFPITADSALNERHYGDLQGLNKAEMVKQYGEEQVHLWRRSYGTRPPNGESIEDCVRRVWPFFQNYILPELKEGKTVLVAAHGNSLRPILMHLDNLDPDTTATMEIPFCVPYIYWFEGEKAVKKEILSVQGMEQKSTAKIA